MMPKQIQWLSALAAMDNSTSSHVLLLPYPSQGHINPMLQFAKRFASRGFTATLAVTRFILRTTRHEACPVRLASISDGCDSAGYAESGSVPSYLDSLKRVGSETLAALLVSEAAQCRPVRLLVFDSFLPWAGDVARCHGGVATAAFFTQASAVNLIYKHVWEGRLEVPVTTTVVQLPALPELRQEDLPSFLPAQMCVYPAYMELVLNQFKYLEKVDEVLINTYYELEPQETDYLKTTCRALTIGPTIPFKYLQEDGGLSLDCNYGFHLFIPEVEPCLTWLDSKPAASVVYVAFGSMVALSAQQMSELALGLANADKHLLWVLRPSEADKLPEGFAEKYADRSMIISWSPQLEVLAHPAIGCFFTHCGWNSTMEALCLGVPMVAMPQWTDQPTNAKYVEDVWKGGVRVRADKEGLVPSEEVERAVREVMEGARSDMMRQNAKRWRRLAKAAVADGGSSDNNINQLTRKYSTG